jgi:hypothetical protein
MPKSISTHRRSRSSHRSLADDWDDGADTIVPRSAHSRARSRARSTAARSTASRRSRSILSSRTAATRRPERYARSEHGRVRERQPCRERVRRVALGAVVGAVLGAAADYVAGLAGGRDYRRRHKTRSVAAGAGLGAISALFSRSRR